MKRKATTLLMLALFTISISASAHSDKEWPLSTKSEEAKQSFKKALDYLWNARVPEYQAKLQEALKADPNFFLARANEALMTYGEKEGDKEKIKEVIAMPQDNLTTPEKLVRKVLVNINEDKMDAAKANLDEIITTYPEAIQSYEFAMGVSRIISEDREAYMSYAQKAVDKFPDHGPAWNQVGYSHLDKGNMEKAKEAFSNYLRLNPDEANAHDSYGDYCMAVNNYDEAQKHYEKAVSMGMTASRERAEKARSLAQAGEDKSDVQEK